MGVSNVLVYLGFYCVAGSLVGSRVSGIVRHPQLTSAMLWAVVEVMVNNHQEGKPALMKTSQSLFREGLAIAVTLGLYGVAAFVHGLLGYPVHGWRG